MTAILWLNRKKNRGWQLHWTNEGHEMIDFAAKSSISAGIKVISMDYICEHCHAVILAAR